MTNTTLSDTPTKPEWADWVEDPDEPHLVTGIRCLECGADVTGTNRDEPSEFGTIWELLNHDDSCEQAREYRFYELNHQDITHLHHLYNLYGRERVVRWLKGNVALPTDLELKKLNGDVVDEEAYYQSAADYYLDLDSESELVNTDTTTHDGEAKMSDNQQANDPENTRSGQNNMDGSTEDSNDETTQDIPLHYEDAMDEAEGETIESITSKADMIVLEMEDGGRLEIDGVVDTPVPMWYTNL